MLRKKIYAMATVLSLGITSLAPIASADVQNVYAAGTNVIDTVPPMPSITRYQNSGWDSNWFRSGTNLQVGDCIYTLDMDPSPSDGKSEYTNGLKKENYCLTTLPDKFVGCDYIITRVDGSKPSKDLHFYLEQDCEIYAAISSSQSSIPGVLSNQSFKKTDGELKIKNGQKFWLAKKDAKAGLTYISKDYGQQGGYAAFYMILPKNGKAVSRALSENNAGIIKEGTKPEKNAADLEYQYYVNDVYNFEESENVPKGYTGSSVSLSALPSGATQTKSYSSGDNLAKGKTYTGANKRDESPIDGDDQTYYESLSCPDKLTVDLQANCKINKIVMKVRNKNSWADRTQNIEIQTSTDGTKYTTLVAKKDYVFNYAKGVEVTFSETTAQYVRIVCNSNTGADGIQMAEVEVYGPAQTVKLVNSEADLNRYLNIASGGTLTKTLDKAIDGKIVYEGKVKTSSTSTEMSIPVMKSENGKTAVELTFGKDGYIKAGNTNVTTYEKDKWYVIKMLIDVDNGFYEVWVDHMRKVQNVPFTDRTAKNIKTLTWSSGSATMNFDNLRLYDNPEVYVVQDKFNGEVTDTAVPENWTVSDATKSAIKNVPFATDKSLQLSSTGTRVEASRKFGPLTGDVTVEVKVRPMSEGWTSMPIIRDSKGNTVLKVAAYHNSFYITNGSNWEYINDQELAHNYYPAGSWYNIKIVLNTFSNRYDFYVDGGKRYSQASFATDVDDVATVAIAAEEENVVYLDNISVYDSASLARGLMPKENVFNVRDFGAKGDGVTDDTAAMDAAFKAAEYTGGTVLLENGTFYCGQITMLSDMTLFVDASAKILSKMNRFDYVHYQPKYNGVVGFNGNHQLGAGVVRSVEGSDNFRITGGGTLDCNGFYDYNQNDPASTKARPCAMYLTSSDDFYVENIDIINSPHWTLVPYESTRMTIRNVAITNHIAPNRDGIDPTNCSNVTIENCHIIAGDDAICPKSGNAFPSINVDVRNCSLQSYCNGIKFGTDSYDDFKNYTFEDCLIKNIGMSGITLQAVDGAEIENIAFKRIDIMDVDNSIAFMVGNRQRANDGLSKHLGHIKGVVIEDMSFVDAMDVPYSHKNENEHASMFVALDPSKHSDGKDAHIISDVYLKNVYMEMPGGYTKEPSISGGIGGGYPEHDGCGNPTGWANTIRWAKDIVFENCQNVLMTNDVRSEYDYKDYYSGENIDNGVEGKIKYGIVFEKNGKALTNPVLSGVIGVGDTSTVLNYSLIQALKNDNGLTIDHDTYDGAIVKCDSKGNLLLYNATGTKVLAEPTMEKFSNEDGQRYVFHIGGSVDEASTTKKALAAALETASAYDGKSGLYTEASWKAFSEAYDAAKKANDSTSASDRQKLLSDLITAIENLARPIGKKIEAESGELTGGASVSNASNCSDGKQVEYLGGVSKGRSSFKVNAEEAGYYEIATVYCQGDARQLSVEVNGVGYAVSCVKTGGWDAPATTPETVVVYLNKGINEIALTGVGTAYAPNVDYVTVSKLGEVVISAEMEKLESTMAAAKAIIDAGQENYTDDSWKAFIEAYEAAENVATNATNETIQKVREELENAKSGLVEKKEEPPVVDTDEAKTALQTAIETAETYKEADYTAESWKEFASALDEAKAVLEDEEATEEELTNAKEALTKAQEALEKEEQEEEDAALKEAKDALEKTVAKVKATFEKGQDNYTEESWTAFVKAYEEATNLTEELTAEDFNNLEAALTAAEAALVKNDEVSDDLAAVRKNLEDAVAEADGVIAKGSEKYTEASWNVFITAYDDAKEILEDQDATAAKMTTCMNRLTAAKNVLKDKDNTSNEALETAKENLLTTVNSAKATYDAGQGNYTADSWKVFADAYNAAKNPKADATEAELKDLQAKLETAKAGLKPVEKNDSNVDQGQGNTQVDPNAGNNQVTLTPEEISVKNTLGVTAEAAKEIYAIVKQYNVSMDTLAVTEAFVTAIDGDDDVKGSTFALLQARAAKQTKNSVKLKWNGVGGADGYLVYGSECGDAYKLLTNLQGSNATSYTHKKLKKGTYYKYLVCAYKNAGNTKVTLAASKTIHTVTKGGKYSEVRTVSVKKSNVKVKVGGSAKIAAKEIKGLKMKKHRKLSYESDDTSIATVSKSGKINAKKKGICNVYVYAQNGVFKKVKVTVK